MTEQANPNFIDDCFIQLRITQELLKFIYPLSGKKLVSMNCFNFLTRSERNPQQYKYNCTEVIKIGLKW